MITRPTSALAALAVAGTLAAGLTGCSSGGSTNGHGTAGGPTPTTAAGLGAKLLSASRSVTSAHLNLNFALAGTTLRGTGNERLSNGRLVALDMTESLPGASFRVIHVGGKTYVKLPPQENHSGKPYVLVSPQSSNPLVQQFAGSLDTAFSAASIKSYDTFVHAAKSIKVNGRDSVNGVSATHYTVLVDVTKLPNTSAFNRQALAQSGIKTIPVELWIDDQGRPVKMTENLQMQGRTLNVVALIGHYNQPVTIKAPPADEVSTK